MVLGGVRACPADAPAGEAGQSSSVEGYLGSDGGAAVQPLSFGRGGSTVCVYDYRPVLVARKVVRTVGGRDRLHVSAVREQGLSTDNLLITATGYVGRTGDISVSPGPEQHVGEVIATALPNGRRCPARVPDPNGPYTGSSRIYDQARFSVQVTVYDAFLRSSRPKVCSYLAAPRRVFADVLPQTVAQASVRVPAAEAPDQSTSDPDIDALVGAVVLLVVTILVCVGVALAVRSVRGSRPSERARHGGAPTRPAEPRVLWPAPAAAATAEALPEPAVRDADAETHRLEAERRRPEMLVPYVIQAALQATADVYRDRLRAILERQDGPGWLDAFNERRRREMVDAGRREPEPYRSFEARAVINCLAFDEAGLQLIPREVAAEARQLSGLAVAAHHPDPGYPLTEEDARRAWRLFTQITGLSAPADPFDLLG
jgi:hypothetical protein